MRGRARSGGGSVSLALAVAMAWLTASSAAVAAASGGTTAPPLAIVRAYLAAMNRHDGAAVCRTFSPRLRAFEIANDAAVSGRRTCAVTVNSHFRDYYSDHRWAGARIASAASTTIDAARGIAMVHTTLAHRYICAGPGIRGEPCHPDIERRPEYIYLVRTGTAGGWQIIKPGLVYRASEIDSASDDESIYYPPGDAAAIARPVSIARPAFSCSASRATIADHIGDVQNADDVRMNAPWLDITRLSVSRIDIHTLCFTLTLAAPPRADSGYGVQIIHDLPSGIEEGTNFGLAIDGLGQTHAQLLGDGALNAPGRAQSRILPRLGLDGDRLEFEVAGPSYFATGLSLHVQAGTASMQPDEPLLTHPLNADDTIAPDRGCLRFPGGGISHAGICADEPGP